MGTKKGDMMEKSKQIPVYLEARTVTDRKSFFEKFPTIKRSELDNLAMQIGIESCMNENLSNIIEELQLRKIGKY